jgi:hypothetical protein
VDTSNGTAAGAGDSPPMPEADDVDGIIIGATIGGLCLLCLLVLIGVWLYKRQSDDTPEVEMRSAHEPTSMYLNDSDSDDKLGGATQPTMQSNSTNAHTMAMSSIERVPVSSDIIYDSLP